MWPAMYFAFTCAVIGMAITFTFMNSKRHKNNVQVIAASNALAELVMNTDRDKTELTAIDVMAILQANEFNRRKMLMAVTLCGEQLGHHQWSDDTITECTTYLSELVYKYY